MFRKMPSQEQCNGYIVTFSVAMYLLVAIGFGVRLGVDHNVVDNVYFSHVIANKTSWSFIVAKEEPAWICFTASIVYAIVALYSVVKANLWVSMFMNKCADALFFSVLLGAVVHLNDVIQITLLFAVYLSFHLVVLDSMQVSRISATVGDTKYATFTIKFVVVILFLTFWLTYMTGLALNWKFNRPGGLVAQLFAACAITSDILSVRSVTRNDPYCGDFQWRSSTEIAQRFILLVCVFVETV